MKSTRETIRTYYKELAAYSTPGEYMLTLNTDTKCGVELYGAGGGWANSHWATDRHYCYSASGGSGAGFKGIVTIPYGTYTIKVGSGGFSKNYDISTGSGGNGEDTSIGELIIAGGGTGGYAVYRNAGGAHKGYGGILTVNNSLDVESFEINSNGNNGSSWTGQAYWVAINGGNSLYDNSQEGYGAGGSQESIYGKDGYCRIFKESDETDYDYYVDVNIYKTLKETNRRYYKYFYRTWVQPILSSNNQDGVQVATNMNTQAYLAMDNNTSTSCRQEGGGGSNMWYLIFSKNALNISQIILNQSGHNDNEYCGGTIYVSNNGINWDTLTTFNRTLNQTITLSNSNYYNQIKLVPNSYTSSGYWNLRELSITATERYSEESNYSDYDYYKDIDFYRAFNI